jgi:hypothetical protein
MLEWLTLCPTWTPLPVIPHLRAIPDLNQLTNVAKKARATALSGNRALSRF